MCTRRNVAAAEAAQEIIKPGCRQQKRLFFAPDGSVRNECVRLASERRRESPEAAAAAGLWTVTGCTKVNLGNSSEYITILGNWYFEVRENLFTFFSALPGVGRVSGTFQ